MKKTITSTIASHVYSLLLTAGLLGLGGITQADVSPDEANMPLQETRSSSFQYYGSTTAWSGMLQSETVEPGTPDQCVTTSYTYDNGNGSAVHGNKTATSISNCAGASSNAQFATRTTSTNYDSAGQFAVSSTNAAG